MGGELRPGAQHFRYRPTLRDAVEGYCRSLALVGCMSTEQREQERERTEQARQHELVSRLGQAVRRGGPVAWWEDSEAHQLLRSQANADDDKLLDVAKILLRSTAEAASHEGLRLSEDDVFTRASYILLRAHRYLSWEARTGAVAKAASSAEAAPRTRDPTPPQERGSKRDRAA